MSPERRTPIFSRPEGPRPDPAPPPPRGYQWDCPNCGQHIESFTLPPPLAQPPKWRAFYDDYDRGTMFIAIDVDTVIADGLTFQQAEAIVLAHNESGVARDSAGDEPA